MVGIRPIRRVDHTVRPEGEDCVDVLSCRHADRIDTAELADVVADLVSRPGVTPDECQPWMFHYGAYGRLTRLSGRPLHDSELVHSHASNISRRQCPRGPHARG